MNRFLLFIFALMMTAAAQAQFINNGATVTIQSGATLRVETSFENQAGTITIDDGGILEVQGNFTNATGTGTTISPTGKVRFIGTGNSDVTLNGDAMPNVEMAKTTSAGKVTLLGNASINGNLEFTGTGNNKIDLGDFDLSLATTSIVSATTDHTTNGYVVTGGTGRLIKAVGAGASPIAMEIGDLSKYSPLQVSMTGNAAGNVSARTAISSLNPKYNDADAYINREWIVSTPTVTSTSLVGTYNLNSPTDVVGTQSNIKGCTFAGGGEWNFNGFAGSGNTVTATTTSNTDVVLSGQNFFGKANLKVFLQGPYNATNGNMNTTLNSLLPTNETPYVASPFLAPSLSGKTIIKPANAVDWIMIEVRDKDNPSTLISKTSGFLLQDGSIVSYDNKPLRMKDAIAKGHIVIKHRNHLAIRTPDNADPNLRGLDLVSNQLHNFKTGTDQAYTITGMGAPTNSNMKLLDVGVYGMWAGDINQDGDIKYNLSDNDRALIYTAIGGASQNSTITGYRIEDLNLDGIVKYNLSDNDRALMYVSIGGASQNAKISVHN